jgi:Spermine/spermidine synthase domain
MTYGNKKAQKSKNKRRMWWKHLNSMATLKTENRNSSLIPLNKHTVSNDFSQSKRLALKKINTLPVVLISLTLISLELAWTRVFSAEFFYSFAFLILSLAVLGLGMGALSVRLFPGLGRDSSLPWLLLLTAVMSVAGPPLAFKVGIDYTTLFNSWAMVGKFVLTAVILASTYFFGGAALTLLFKRGHEDLPRLYMADMTGAGLGVVLAVLVMNVLGTPVAVFYCGLPVLLGAFLTLPKWAKVLPLLVLGAMVFMGLQADTLLHKERQERGPVGYTHWDAVAKVKIYEFSEEYHGLEIDNAANSPVHAFDGDYTLPDTAAAIFGIDVRNLIEQFDDCSFLSLGAGGGGDVLQALLYGATDIHAAEVVPHINHLMTDGHLADFSGNIYQDPRVTVATEDARSYVRRFENKFDIIYSLSSNTFAALASGSFAMAENYLFTKEAFKDYWLALSDDGYLSMEHQFYMPRLATEAIQALKELGVENPEDHFAIYNLPQMRRKLLLLSKRPLTDEIRQTAYWPMTAENHEQIHLLYPAAEADQDNIYQRIVNEGWQAVAPELPIDISPCDDNRPFAAQLGLWKNFELGSLEKISPYEFRGFPLAKLLVGVILAISIVLIVPLNLLPYLRGGVRLKAVPWLYFFMLGMGFMMVEVVLIQQFTLLIGPSVYSLVTILTTLLVCSGLGSRFSPVVGDRFPFLGILIWLAADVLLFPLVATTFGGMTIVPRMAVSALLIAPLGFFMGMPFPKGGRRVGELIDWGFAVNGTASVIGSTLIILVAFVAGFRVALMLGGLVYLMAWVLLNRRSAWN